MSTDSKVSGLRFTLCTEDDDDIICIDQKQSLFSQGPPTNRNYLEVYSVDSLLNVVIAFAALNDLRCNGQLCDIVLVVEGRKISAHRVVLAASIPYFRVMFTTEMLEANQTEVVLQELDYETLEQLVSFAYCGELRISAGNVQSIMIGANFLQLSVDDVVELLCMDGLYVESEEAVFEAAFRWIQHDREKRKKYASRLLACVRLPLLKPSFLADEVAGHQLIRGDLACRDLVSCIYLPQLIIHENKLLI
ncbi:BTB/POZ domain protein [Ancylostoma duodenale]|uniref:BTB/POZ domain protein n=1 Tax=Ancylostoma duodenale TaxID=51022 RepID=A0A0C2GBI7_9BILA|nr:BTB/POZ domain protein [Ancylostoma duodenale]